MRRVIAPALALALSGCMVGPNYHRPAMPVPAAYKEAPGWTKATPDDGAPKGDWWTGYGDADLDRLEPLVKVSNQTLAADYDAYQQAVQVAQEERGALFPTLGLTGSATRSSGSGGGGSGGGFSVGPQTSGTFEGSADWTPDIWGKIRRQVQSDVAAAQINAADLANATLSAQATLAEDYISMRGQDAQISLLQQTLVAYQQSLRITENQANAGVAAPADVITARTQLEGTQAQLISAAETRAQDEHAIAVLVGHAPAELTLPPGPQLAVIPPIPPSVPSTLLQRRPDIAAAERTMAEQNAAIGVAVGAFFPDISLSAVGGYAANPIGGLFNVSSALWSLGVDASETLFEGGTRNAEVKVAQFGYRESVANYRQTVLAALQQVEDQLSNLRILASQGQAVDAAVQDAQRAVQISLNEYQAGTQAYTTVVTAQVTLLGDQETALQVQQDRLVASVALIQALGGGFNAAQLPSADALQATLPFLQ